MREHENRIQPHRRAAGSLVCALLLGACRAPSTDVEERARMDVERVGSERAALELPALSAESTLDDFARYAVLRNPRVVERFEAWARAVEEVTLARFPPDPSFTLMPEIERGIENVFVGLMAGPTDLRKLALAAEARSHAARARRLEFEAEVAATAARVRSAHVEAAFLGESLRVTREVRELLEELLLLADAQYRVSRVTRQDVLRLSIERDVLENELASLEDRAGVALARLREALGIPPSEPDPPLPARLSDAAGLPPGDLVAAVLARNPELRALAAEVEEAEGLIALARRSRWPDWTLDLDVGLESPTLVTAEIGASLPWVYPDKVRASIAAALAARRSGGARLEGKRLELVLELAEQSFRYRDAGRRAALLGGRLLPTALEALEVARAGYVTGSTDLTSLLDAERSLYRFRLSLAEARMEQEVAWSRITLELLARTEEYAPFLEDRS